MNKPATYSAALGLLMLVVAGCTAIGGAPDEVEPVVIDAEPAPPAEAIDSIDETAPIAAEVSKQEEGEVPLAVAESEHPDQAPEEVVVEGSRVRHQVIHDLVAEG
jgi:hypothetical protein